MAMADLAQQGDKACVSLSDIASRQNISLTYLEQLFAKLRRAGLVESHRGSKGGYSLAATSQSIALDKIIAAVDEDIKAHGCTPETRLTCTGKDTRCITHDLWGALEAHIEGFLASVTLDDVVHGRLPVLEAAE